MGTVNTGNGLMAQISQSNTHTYTGIDENLISEYLEVVGMEPEKHKYSVKLDASKAEVYKKSTDKTKFVIYLNGEVQVIPSLSFEFTADKHFTRSELLDYLEGTQGIIELHGYKKGKAYTKEEILEEIQLQLEDLI